MTHESSSTIERDMRDLTDYDLLARALPQVQRDVLEDLVVRLGGLLGIYHASVRDLCLTPGITPKRAEQLHATLELGLRLGQQRGDRPQMTSAERIVLHVPASLGVAPQEELWCMVLDTKSRILATTMIARGTADAITIEPADIFRCVLKYHGTRVVLLHNHPSLDPTPSSEDRSITRELVRAGELIGIDVLDHLILGGHEWVSLRTDSPHLWH